MVAAEERPTGVKIGDSKTWYSRVPGDAGELFFTRFPFGAGEDARGDFDEARSELKDCGGVPWAAVAGAIFADVERVGHAVEGNVLDDHFGDEAECLHLERVVFQVTAIGADAQAKGNLLGGGGNLFWLGGRRGFHFALPFKGDQGPASVVHLGKISGSGEDADSFTHAINLFHGSLQDECWLDPRDVISR